MTTEGSDPIRKVDTTAIQGSEARLVRGGGVPGNPSREAILRKRGRI